MVENNQWAYGTPTHLEYPLEDFARRADGYGIPGLVADGQDVFDVYDKVMVIGHYTKRDAVNIENGSQPEQVVLNPVSAMFIGTTT